MPAPVYLGDEVSGTGWRLAGAEVHTPVAGGETAALQAACGRPVQHVVSMLEARMAALRAGGAR